MLKKIGVFAGIIALFSWPTALAALPPTSLQGPLDTSAKTTFKTIVPTSTVTHNGTVAYVTTTAKKNFAANPSAVVSATANWTASNVSVARDTDAGDKLDAIASFALTSATNPATFTSDAMTLDDGITGNCEFSFKYKGDATKWILNLDNGSGTTLAQTSALTNSTDWTEAWQTFPCASGYKLQLATTAASPADLNVGAFYWGEAVHLTNVSQSYLYAARKWAVTTNCQWSGTTTSYDDFGVDTDCDDNTITYYGKASAGDVTPGQLPQIYVSSIEPGDYYFVVKGKFYNDYASADDAASYFRISDGTNTFGNKYLRAKATTRLADSDVVGNIRYTTAQGATTFKIQYKNAATNTYLGGDDIPFEIYIYKFPLSSQLAVTPDLTSAFAGVQITGEASHISTLSGASYAKFTDADVVAGDKTHYGRAIITATAGDFGYKVASVPAGSYTLHAQGQLYAQYSGSTTECAFGISDDGGTTLLGQIPIYHDNSETYVQKSDLIGVVTYTSPQTDKEYTLVGKRVSGGGSCTVEANATHKPVILFMIPTTQNIPAPLLVHSVVSKYAGVKKNISATLNCDAGSAITSQDGSVTEGVASIGNISSGACAIAFAGMGSTTPRCDRPNVLGTTKDVAAQLNPTSATAATLYCTKPSDGSDLTSCDVDISCWFNQ